MKKDKVAVIGFTNSGKTTYAIGMYSIMCDGIGSFSLKEHDRDQHTYLFKIWKKMLSNEEWPMPSDAKSVYTFDLLHNLIPVIKFDWLDYPGAVVVDDEHELADDFRKDLSEASCLLVLINGESFAFEGDPVNQQKIQAQSEAQYQRIVRRNLSHNNDLRAIGALANLGIMGIALPPTAIVVSKSDLIDDQWVGCVPGIITQSFAPIFGANCPDERIVMLSAVTLGNIAEGDVDPYNVEEPVAFAVLSILREKIQLKNLLKKEAEGKLSEKDKGLFRNLFRGSEIARLKKEIADTDADIQKLVKDAHFLLDLFDLDKPIYINNVKKDLREFFTQELK